MGEPDSVGCDLDAIASLIIIADPAGNILRINLACESARGLHRREVIGRPLWDLLFLPGEANSVKDEFARLLAGHSTHRFENSWPAADGTRQVISWSVTATLDAQGEVRSIVATGANVTEQRKIQHETSEREGIYRDIVETAHEGIWVIDSDGCTRYANPRITEMLGYTEAEMAALSIYDCMEPADHAAFKRRLEARRHGERQILEWRCLRKDRSEMWTTVSSNPVFDSQGRFIGVLGMVTDISARKRTEEALRQSEERFRVIVENSPDLMFYMDENFRFDWVSRMNRNTRLANAVGKTMLEVVGESDAARIGPVMRRVMSTGVVEHVETTAHINGQDYHYDTALTRRIDSQGRTCGIAAYIRDVTERKMAEQALQKLNETLEHRIAERTEQLRQSESHYRELAESNRLLAREVEHRVGNNLAALIGLVSAMRGRMRSVDAFAEAIEVRLQAMAQIHRLLAGSGWRPLGLREMVTTVFDSMEHIAPCAIEEKVQGDNVAIPAAKAPALLLILVEWYTNSCKYGAHRHEQGAVNVSWTMNRNGKGDIVQLTWQERSDSAPREPLAPSLGTELVHAFASRELRGTCSMTFPATGARHTLEFPL